MGFPALLLPEVAFRHVHQFLDYTELILLSQCSKTTYSLVKSIESSNKSARINITTDSTQMRVELSDGDEETDKNWRSSCWSLHMKRDPMTVFMTEFKVYRIGECVWTVCPHPFGIRIRDDYKVDYLIFWVDILKDLFNCKLGECRYEFAANFDFNRLFCSSSTLRVADKITISGLKFSDREMECVMDNFTTNHFHFDGSTDNDYFYDKPIRFSDATLSSWYIHDFANFMDYIESCETLHLSDRRITDEQINSVIRGWMESDNTKLAGVTFERTRGTTRGNFNLEKVLKDITTAPGTNKRREATKHRIDNENFEEGRDLMRKDGVLATVLKHRRGYGSKKISLIVWSDKDCYLPD